MRTLYGTGKKYKSPRALSFAIGRDPGAISKIEHSGNATPEMVVALARACDQSPVKFLIVAGLLTDSDTQFPATKLSGQEEELVAGFQSLPGEGQRWMLGSLQGMLGTATQTDEVRRVAEGSQGYRPGSK